MTQQQIWGVIFMLLNRKNLYLLFALVTICLSGSIAAAEKPTRFYIVRHGQTDWNVQGKVQGHSDIPLNSTGKKESASLIKVFKTISLDVCFSSDLKRAYETALIISQGHSMPVLTDKRLRERDYGRWEGRPSKEYNAASASERAKVESDDALRNRIFTFLNEVVVQHRGQTILVVTHGGVMRSILMQVLNLNSSSDIKVKNAAVVRLSVCKGQWVVEEMQGIAVEAAATR